MSQLIICDLDGCLNNYPQCFVDWVNSKLGVNFDSITQAKESLGEKYESVKYDYRICGAKRELEVREGAEKVLRLLRKRGYRIHIITHRPAFSPVKEDTMYWLQKNRLEYDELVFTNEKYGYVSRYKNDIAFIIEDDTELAARIKSDGIKVFVFGGETKTWHDIECSYDK